MSTEENNGLIYGGLCRNMGECQAAVAEAVEVFGGLDILLCCTSEGRRLWKLGQGFLLTSWNSPHRYSGRARSFSSNADAGTGTV